MQNEAVRKFTSQNQAYLNKYGFDTNSANLYAAHFLGAGSAVDVLGSSNETPLTSILSQKVLTANKFLQNMTVGDFKKWLQKKTGDAATSGDGSGSKPNGGIIDALTPTWVSNLLNGHTAARWSSVIIGIILIALAVGAFVYKTEIKEAIT